MLPLQTVGSHVVRADVHFLVVLAPVLHDDRPDLVFHVAHVDAAVEHGHRHLLVALVEVDVGICGDAHANLHQRLHDPELSAEHLLVAVVLVVDVQAVVAAHLQPTAVVGNL